MDSVLTDRWLEAQVHQAAALWHASAGPWIHPSPSFTLREQRARERAYDGALGDVQRLTRASARTAAAETEHRLIAAFAGFAAHALSLGPDTIDLLTHSFLPVGAELARWAHRFDPALPNAGIVQACRNAWTACGLQPLLGAPMALTPAILAYSLLYPYTDNYLDQRSIAQDDKLRFNHRFRLRLQGNSLAPAGHHESCAWHMVALIEQQFPLPHHPDVYASLLAIHAAQEQSVLQLGQSRSLHESTLLRITCAKGGTSVLADAALVHGILALGEAQFSFLWGALLQLGDDLQDIHEDLARGSETLFTRALRAGHPLDALVSQLLNLSDLTAARMDELPCGTPTHKALLRMSWRSLIQMAVAQADEFFTTPFLAELESRSPFRFAFLRSRRKKLDGNSGLFERLFEILLDGETESPRVPQVRGPQRQVLVAGVEAPGFRTWEPGTLAPPQTQGAPS
ncbi:MAG: hypothetical protein WBX09_19330 [Terracidiphilus sp.]